MTAQSEGAVLLELAARVEALTGADFETDRAIDVVVRKGGYWSPPAYTASLDAALTLVPEDEPVTLGMRQTSTTLPWARIGKPWHGADTTAATPALALTAASLRARAAQVRGEEG
ncbi:hypothetical protein [Roseomonas indoligenes]|uniref:Uncharacterized protein n=1 Tax=Roseomonas indoligenes TaxID=2820811 RepID=A0A940MRG8_9PROT|nr:hypothetical protein [Pararoseomonas indoligenes]MBP0492124.1 hypothetical protein [Pararoseomonas indoligenes]